MIYPAIPGMIGFEARLISGKYAVVIEEIQDAMDP